MNYKHVLEGAAKASVPAVIPRITLDNRAAMMPAFMSGTAQQQYSLITGML